MSELGEKVIPVSDLLRSALAIEHTDLRKDFQGIFYFHLIADLDLRPA